MIFHLGWIIVLTLIFLFFSGLIVLAALGKSFGVRRKYVDILLKAFEFGKERIAIAEKKHRESTVIPPDQQFLTNGFSNNPLISREGVKLEPEPAKAIPRNRSFNTFQKEFQLADAFDFIKAGVEAIIDDEVTKRFAAEELPSWNLLTRTNKNYQYMSMRLTVLWCIGGIIRYAILLPARVTLTFFGVGWLVVSTSLIGCIPEGRFKRWIYWQASVICFRILSRALSTVITQHNKENMARGGGICVANHTSPIDIVILASDNSYALVGQSQGGFLGIFQWALKRATSHIWFERSELNDRAAVQRRLRKHVEDPEKLPILIFPEGTCINNTSVMMFKKGSFEVGATIYPVAIKYDPRFGDPFWNSSKHGYIHYLLMMMSSWAIVCDVWYLPPMTKKDDENAVEFANRVKAEIARQGGLVDLVWDGQLKRSQVKREWKEQQQEKYSKRIKVNSSTA